jgi:hypothetical protein
MSLTKLVKLSFKSKVAKALGLVPLEILHKAQRSLMVGEASEVVSGARLREPEWDYAKLLDFAETTWLLQSIYNAIIREVCSPGWHKTAKFVTKCTNLDCGQEFQQKVAACSNCKGTTRVPDAAQGLALDKLFQKPNSDHEFSQIIKSLKWQGLAVDDWFVSISYAESVVGTDPITQQPVKIRTAKEIWVEDSATIKIMADKHGKLGSDEFFCPQCYDEKETDEYFPEDQVICPHCNGSLVETCYVQELEGKITARFGKDEMIHNNSGKNLPRLFGKPRLVSLLRLILAMQYQDRYNMATYSKGELKNVVAFPEMNQDEIDEMYNAIDAQMSSFQVDPETGESTRPTRSLWVGVKQPPLQLPMLPPSRDMQAIEWYKIYREAIASVYSVTPVFIGIIESGRSGNNPQMQIDVQNRATKEEQQSLEEPFNNQLLPRFGIHDWIMEFGEVEVDDELRRAQINVQKANAANIYSTAGFTVTLDDQGELVVSGRANTLTANPLGPQPTSNPPSMTLKTPPLSMKKSAKSKSKRLRRSHGIAKE